MISAKSFLQIKRLFAGVFCTALVFVFVQSISARTLEEYKKSINQIKGEIAALLLPTEDADENREEKIEQVFGRVFTELTIKRDVEVNNLTFEVNNDWLVENIKEYRKPGTSEPQKRFLLEVMYERLESIEARIEEFQNATANGRNKDDEKRKLAEILKREEYKKPVEEKSLLDQILEWIENMFRRFAPDPPKPMPKSNLGGFAYVLQILLYILVAAIVLFLIYKFAPFLIKKFRERERNEKKERIILGEKISADETSENLFSEAEKLAIKGEMREAIRKGYIALLFELSERKLIGLAKHKTNRDYLRSVRKKRDLHGDMIDLTINYERHWYGLDEADKTDWEKFKETYNKALGKESVS